jgi:hypothetical protein
LKTNTSAVRRRGGQPGNDNALKHGCHTAQMRALRAEVRFAVLKAKALSKAAWNSETWPKAGAGKSARAGAPAVRLSGDAEIAGPQPRVGQAEALRGQPAAQQLADGGGPARHVRGKAPAVERLKLAGGQHDLEAFLPAVRAHGSSPCDVPDALLTHNAQMLQVVPVAQNKSLKAVPEPVQAAD